MFADIVRLLANRSRTRSRVPQAPSHRVRLELEVLETRQVPSAVSAISFSDFAGSYEHLFAIDSKTREVVDYITSQGGVAEKFLSGPGSFPTNVTAVSASIDPSGGAEVFALAGDHSVWNWNFAHDWIDLGGWASEISASRDGHVYAIGNGYQVFSNSDFGSSSTWQSLGAPVVIVGFGPGGGMVTASQAYEISAGNYAAGKDDVFAIGVGGGIYVNYPGSSGGWQLVDNQHNFTKLSATQNGSVYALDANGALYQEIAYFYVSHLHVVSGWSEQAIAAPSSGDTFTAISAGTNAAGQDVIYAIDRNGTAWLSSAGKWQAMAYGVREIAASDNGDFFYVRSNSPTLHTANGTEYALGGSVL